MRSIKLNPVLAIMAGLLAWAMAVQLQAALSWGHGSWQLTEWLINYSGGFVRRGLTGSIVGLISGSTGIQANHVVIVAALSCYLLLLACFLRSATREFPPVLVLSCIVMGFPAYQDSIIRKDCLGLLLLWGCLKADSSRMPRPLVFLAVNVLACIAILSHETFVFYALPALLLFTGPETPGNAGLRFLRRCAMLIPAAVCFAVAVTHHGSSETAQAVNDSWLPLWRITDPGNTGVHEPAAAIEALGWDTSKGLSLGIYLLTSGIYQPFAWLTVFVIAFILVVLFTGRRPGDTKSPLTPARLRMMTILIVQLLFISPLFLLGVDYGRWLFLWVGASMMVHVQHLAPAGWIESGVKRMIRTIRLPALFDRLPVRDWYLLGFGVPVCWNIHNFLFASPAARPIEILWSWF